MKVYDILITLLLSEQLHIHTSLFLEEKHVNKNEFYYAIKSLQANTKRVLEASKKIGIDTDVNNELSVGLYNLFRSDNLEAIHVLLELSKRIFDKEITHENIVVIEDKEKLNEIQKLLNGKY